MRIFCDVDGTLRKPDDGEINMELVEALLDVVLAERTTLVVWSGGGAGYASRWAIESGLYEFTAAELAKGPRMLQDTDIVIDDMLEEDLSGLIGKASVTVYTPEQFIEWVRAGKEMRGA